MSSKHQFTTDQYEYPYDLPPPPEFPPPLTSPQSQISLTPDLPRRISLPKVIESKSPGVISLPKSTTKRKTPLLSRYDKNQFTHKDVPINANQYNWLKDNIDVEGGEGEYGDEYLNIHAATEAQKQAVEKRIDSIKDNSYNDLDAGDYVKKYFNIANYNNEQREGNHNNEQHAENDKKMWMMRNRIEDAEKTIQKNADIKDILLRGGVDGPTMTKKFKEAMYNGKYPKQIKRRENANLFIEDKLKKLPDFVGGKKRKQTLKRKKSKRTTNKKQQRKRNARGKSRKK